MLKKGILIDTFLALLIFLTACGSCFSADADMDWCSINARQYKDWKHLLEGKMGAIARGTSFKNWVVSYEVRCEITSNTVITVDDNANDSTSWCQAYEEAYHNWKRSLLITNGDLKDHYQKTIAIYESRC